MAPTRDIEDGRHDDRDAPGAPRPSGPHGTTDHPLETVKHGIEQVADKVKGLLRSDR